ncbi:MAG: gliding motility protein GldD [Tannerella sp.]|nr:gliding motility protein GldD [Tannerella sp.]
MKMRITLPILLLVFTSCSGNYTPKPLGYLRFDPPSTSYFTFGTDSLPYSFSVSRLAIIESLHNDDTTKWLNIRYPDFKATLFCTLNKTNPEILGRQVDECVTLAIKSIKTKGDVKETDYEDVDKKVFAKMFTIVDGESSSPIRFLLTDSATNFFSGALYYDFDAKTDSIAPVTDYIKQDIIRIIQTFSWNE